MSYNSRGYLEAKPGYTSIAVGLCDVSGFFVQVYQDGIEDPVIDLDMFGPSKSNRFVIAKVVDKYAVDDEIKRAVITALHMDCCPVNYMGVKRARQIVEARKLRESVTWMRSKCSSENM